MCVVTFDWERNDAREKVDSFLKRGTLAWAVVELTHDCNFRCKWCYASAAAGKRGTTMSLERASYMLNLFAEHSDVKQITCSGGEPLLYPHLDEFVKRASDLGFIVHINTNGYLLDRERAETLASLGLTQVQINVDSMDPKKHDRIRGMRNSRKRAVQALENCSDAGIKTVMQTVLSKDNENEIFDIFEFALELGMDRSRVWDMLPVGSAFEREDLRPSDFLDTLAKLENFAHENGCRYAESGDPMFPGGRATKVNVYGGFCAAMRGGFVTISPKGDVYPCATQREYVLYNIFEIEHQTLFRQLHGYSVGGYRRALEIAEECRGCSLKKTCLSGCPTRRSPGRLDYWCEGGTREYVKRTRNIRA
jgi:radical SAM protein with 4Fe4S-binding SPASM domain